MLVTYEIIGDNSVISKMTVNSFKKIQNAIDLISNKKDIFKRIKKARRLHYKIILLIIYTRITMILLILFSEKLFYIKGTKTIKSL